MIRRRSTGRSASTERRGFTIIELTIFLAVLAIFCKLAIICYGHAIECISEAASKAGVSQITAVINYNEAINGDLPDVYDSLFDVNTGQLIPGLPPQFYNTLPPDLLIEPLTPDEVDALAARGITAMVITDSSLPVPRQVVPITPGLPVVKWQRDWRTQPVDTNGNGQFDTPPPGTGDNELIRRCRTLCLGIPGESTLCRSDYPMFFKDIPTTPQASGQDYPYYVLELTIAEDTDGDDIVFPGEGVLDAVRVDSVIDPWNT